MLFTVLSCGFTPRLALESSDSGQTRIAKIVKLIRESKYSIHDISRLQAKRAGEYYRLNMPFELGLDYGIRLSSKNHQDKRALVLETKRYDYMKAISDLNGFDIKAHANDVETLIRSIRNWFSETADVADLSGAKMIIEDYLVSYPVFTLKNNINDIQSKRKISLEKAEQYAIDKIDGFTIPEFIQSVKDWQKSIV